MIDLLVTVYFWWRYWIFHLKKNLVSHNVLWTVWTSKGRKWYELILLPSFLTKLSGLSTTIKLGFNILILHYLLNPSVLRHFASKRSEKTCQQKLAPVHVFSSGAWLIVYWHDALQSGNFVGRGTRLDSTRPDPTTRRDDSEWSGDWWCFFVFRSPMHS